MIMILLILIICVVLLIFVLIGNYFFEIAFNPHISKKYILRSLTKEEAFEEKKNLEEGKRWLEEFAKEIDILSKEGFLLHGYEVKNLIKRTEEWVILLHGYMGNSAEMVKAAKKFIQMGCHVLLIDLRAHGKSGGKYIGMGWKDKNDLLEWINYVRLKYKHSHIILYGISMGAATVMMTAGENLPKNVDMCIEDCGYTSVEEEFNSLLQSIHPWIKTFLIKAISFVTKLRIGYTFKEASCLKQLKKSKIPILFIHGSRDRFVPFVMLEQLYLVANGKKQKLIIKNASHAESMKMNSQLYWNTVENFVKRYSKRKEEF